MLQEHIVARHDVTGGRTQTQARIHALRYWNSKSYEPVVPKCGARTIGTRKLSKSGTWISLLSVLLHENIKSQKSFNYRILLRDF